MGCTFYTHHASLDTRQKLHKLDQGVSLLFHFRHGWPSRAEATGIPTEPARPKWEAHQDKNQVKGQQKQLHLSCHSREILEPHLAAGQGN